MPARVSRSETRKFAVVAISYTDALNFVVELFARPGNARAVHLRILIGTVLVFYACTAGAVTGRIIKVLPQYLDKAGRHALSPSLFERDAYQARLQRHPELRDGLRFAVQWKVKGKPAEPLKLRVEIRGVTAENTPHELVFEQTVRRKRWFAQWSYPCIRGDNYKRLGEMRAWRVTLWAGDTLLAEQRSFLW